MTTKSLHEPWPTLKPLHLQAIMFAYNEGYSKAYDKRVFNNPFAEDGSQAAAWKLGTKEGIENRNHDDEIRATINSNANRDELLLINKKQELGVAENDRLIDQLRAELEDAQGLHQAHIKECYRYLGIDGSDGEYRSKWVLLELSKLHKPPIAPSMKHFVACDTTVNGPNEMELCFERRDQAEKAAIDLNHCLQENIIYWRREHAKMAEQLKDADESPKA